MSDFDPQDYLNGEFLRPKLAFEREYMQVRNAWLRDERIVGVTLSVFLFLVSHTEGYRLTQATVREQLGLSQERMLSARRVLEQHGYVETVEMRYTRGARTREGKPIAGLKFMIFIVKDPWADELAIPSGAASRAVDNSAASGPRGPVDKAKPENPARLLARPGAEQAKPENPARPDEAKPENPGQAFPAPIEKTKIKKPRLMRMIRASSNRTSGVRGRVSSTRRSGRSRR